MKLPNSHAASRGVSLRTQLDKIIAELPMREPAKPVKRLSRRLRCAIEAIRRYICSEAGCKVAEVDNKRVAKLALKLDWHWLYENNFYIGFETLNEFQLWAQDTLAGGKYEE